MTCASVTRSLRPEHQHSKEVDPLKKDFMTVTTVVLAGPTSGAVSST